MLMLINLCTTIVVASGFMYYIEVLKDHGMSHPLLNRVATDLKIGSIENRSPEQQLVY